MFLTALAASHGGTDRGLIYIHIHRYTNIFMRQTDKTKIIVYNKQYFRQSRRRPKKYSLIALTFVSPYSLSYSSTQYYFLYERMFTSWGFVVDHHYLSLSESDYFSIKIRWYLWWYRAFLRAARMRWFIMYVEVPIERLLILFCFFYHHYNRNYQYYFYYLYFIDRPDYFVASSWVPMTFLFSLFYYWMIV